MSLDVQGQTAPLPAPDAAPVPAAPLAWSRRPKGISLIAAARLLAEGRSIAEVAGMVGCSRQNLWRQVRRSRRLGVLLRYHEQEARTDAHGKLAGLGDAAVETLRRAVSEENDAAIAYRVVDRLDLFERPAMADPMRGRVSGGRAELAAVLASVTEKALTASRTRHIRYSPGEYVMLWDQAVRERAELREAGATRRRRRRH